MKVKKVISGGQTGADRGGLDAAILAGVEVGGWCPRGRKAEDGRIPDQYPLKEHESPDYPPRTLANIKDSDGTVIFTFGPAERGSALTIHLSKKLDKPFLHIDLKKTNAHQASVLVWLFLRKNRVATVNIAGNRESKSPGIGRLVENVMKRILVSKEKR